MSDHWEIEQSWDQDLVDNILQANPLALGFCLDGAHEKVMHPNCERQELRQQNGSLIGYVFIWKHNDGDDVPALTTNACIYRGTDIKSALTAASTIAEFWTKLHYNFFHNTKNQAAYFSFSEPIARRQSISVEMALQNWFCEPKSKIAAIPPLISIALFDITTESEFLDSLQSIQLQTDSNWKLKVLLEETPTTLRNYVENAILADPRCSISIVPSTKTPETLNFAFALCDTSFLLPLRAGDTLASNAVSTFCTHLTDASSIIYSDWTRQAAKSDYVRSIDEAEFSNVTRVEPGLPYSSLIRCETWLKLGGFSDLMNLGSEDFEFWINCAAHDIKVQRVAATLLNLRYNPERQKLANTHLLELRSQIILNHSRMFSPATVSQANVVGGIRKQKGAPLISVIVPTFNRPDRLVEAIASISQQTFTNFEIIVVNDAGQTIAPEIIAMDQRIVYLVHENNRGLAGSRSTGLRAARGTYIAYLDDDDRFYPQHLEILLKHIRALNADFVYSDSARAWEDKDSRQIWKRDLPFSEEYNGNDIFLRNITPVLTVLHKRSLIEQIGYFDESLSRTEDWDFWRRISLITNLHHIPRITSEYTWHAVGSSMSSSWFAPFYWAQLKILVKDRYAVISRLIHEALLSQAIKENIVNLLLAFKNTGPLSPADARKKLLIRDDLEVAPLVQQLLHTDPSLEAFLNPLASLLGVNIKPLPQLQIQPVKDLLSGRRKNGLTSVIVPVYNSWHFTQQLLDCIFSSVGELPIELIIVDNNSTDETPSKLAHFSDKARIIRNPVNKNFSGACNQGAMAANGEFILFLNNDILLKPGWLEPMLAYMQDPNIAIVGNRQLYGDQLTVHHCGVHFFETGAPDHILRGVDHTDPRTKLSRKLNCVTASCMLVRATAFFDAGGFDEGYINGFEDVDFCLKVRSFTSAVKALVAIYLVNKIGNHCADAGIKDSHLIARN